MALKQYLCTAVALLMLPACRSTTPSAPTAERGGPEPLAVTRWTDKTELFAEYPPLVVGNTSRFAIHFTQLEPFKAVTDGAVEVQLRGDGGDIETFRVDKPSRPGVFGVDVTPVRPGKRQLAITLRSSMVTDEHQVGPVDVFPDAAAAAAAPPPPVEGESISFLKEQQWALNFGTAVVRERALRTSIRVPAQISARPGGQADVVAPIDGRLTMLADLGAGANVSRGQELARLMPPPSLPADLPQLEHQRTEAVASLQYATRDRDRAERLVQAGAAPAKRLEEARAVETQAAARVKSIEAQLTQYNASRTASGAGSGQGLFVVRAPIGGVIAERLAASGANVSAGSVLFRIIDPVQVQVVGRIPESEAGRAGAVKGANIEVPGTGVMHPAGRMLPIGRVLDMQSRTLPIVFALDNTRLGLAVGQSVSLQLLLDQSAPAPVIAASAIVDDAGRPIVFVQVEGESFERRPVTLGSREGDFVQVTSGVTSGERVVTKGAYLVRLASLSTSVPAHGHVH